MFFNPQKMVVDERFQSNMENEKEDRWLPMQILDSVWNTTFLPEDVQVEVMRVGSIYLVHLSPVLDTFHTLNWKSNSNLYTHTHTHTYIYIIYCINCYCKCRSSYATIKYFRVLWEFFLKCQLAVWERFPYL